MAAALSRNSLIFSPPPPSARPPRKSLDCSKALALPATGAPAPRKSLSFQLHRRPFGVPLRVADAESKIINGDEPQGQGPEGSLSLKVLLQAYKKAILDEDERVISEIEAAICVIENKKNNLSAKLEELTAKISSGKEKFLRLNADFENYRRRSEKDRLSLTSRAQGEVIESLLPLVDSFEKAKEHLKLETDEEIKIGASYQGIYKQFVEIMRSLRVAVVGTVGKPFDPSIHEAIGREESHQYKEGIVTQELCRGFVLGERLLRPAIVKVSSGLGPSKVPSAAGNTTAESSSA